MNIVALNGGLLKLNMAKIQAIDGENLTITSDLVRKNLPVCDVLDLLK